MEVLLYINAKFEQKSRYEILCLQILYKKWLNVNLDIFEWKKVNNSYLSNAQNNNKK